MNALPIMIFMLFFIFVILMALKMEDHFSYLKMLDPKKYDRFSSLVDVQRKMSFIGMDVSFIVFVPVFINRNLQAELNDPKLKNIGHKIQKRCYQLWFTLLLIIAIIVIILLTPR